MTRVDRVIEGIRGRLSKHRVKYFMDGIYHVRYASQSGYEFIEVVW